MLEKINHIAIAVPNINEAIKLYKNALNAECSEIMEVENFGVKVAFIKLSGTKVEFLEPLNESSSIQKFLLKNPKGGLHHICYDVEDLESAVQNMEKSGVTLLPPGISMGSQGKKVAFFSPKDTLGVLTELQQI